jgi:hypothetical protein
MNVEIGAEAALFPEKEYIKWIFVAVHPFNPAASDHKILYKPILFDLLHGTLKVLVSSVQYTGCTTPPTRGHKTMKFRPILYEPLTR